MLICTDRVRLTGVTASIGKLSSLPRGGASGRRLSRGPGVGGGLQQMLSTALVAASHRVRHQRVGLVLAADDRAQLAGDGRREAVRAEQLVT